MDISKIDKNFLVNTNISREGMVFYNVDEAPISVHGLLKEDGVYRRMPDAVAKSVSEGVHSLNSGTTGGRIRFATDSPYVAIVTKQYNIPTCGPHSTFLGAAGFDIYADNCYVKSFLPPVDMKEGFSSIADFEDRKMREILINFPRTSGVSEVYIGLAEDASLKEAAPYRNRKPIVYYGSSITQGGCASRPGTTYENFVSRRLNCDYVNLGFSGNAKGEQEIVDYINGLEMSVFVLDYDHNAPNPEHLAATHERMFKAIRAGHPNLPIVMMPRPKCVVNQDDNRRREVVETTYRNALAAGDQNVYYISSAELTALCGNEGTVDNCHPNDLGMMAMAEAVLKVLQGLFIE